MDNAEKLRSIADEMPLKKAILLSATQPIFHPLIDLLMSMMEEIIRNTDISNTEDASEKINQLNELINHFMEVCLQ